MATTSSRQQSPAPVTHASASDPDEIDQSDDAEYGDVDSEYGDSDNIASNEEVRKPFKRTRNKAGKITMLFI